MTEGVHNGVVPAAQVVREAEVQQANNGIRYAVFGDTRLEPRDLERMVQAVPITVAGALVSKSYYFVPLAIGETKPADSTVVAPDYTQELADLAICHRNVPSDGGEAVLISSRLLADRFALAFEFFINIAHAFVDALGVPAGFEELVCAQAIADVRGETSQDAWESRALALTPRDGQDTIAGRRIFDEKAKTSYLESAFSDALAIYQLSLSVDFDYSELREREYPLLAPQALAERLRLVAKLFPPNHGYEFAIRYRKRA